MIGILAFIAFAVSAVLGQECSFNGLSQNFVDIASPVSSLSGNFLSSGIRSCPSARSQIVSSPVFLNDGPALMPQATCGSSGSLVATPAVSQSLSPVGSVSSALCGSGSSSFNSAVGSSNVISVASAVPAYVSSRIPCDQVASSSISVPSFRTVSSRSVQYVTVPSGCSGSSVSAPSVISSGLFQSPVSQVVSSAPSVQSVQSSFVPSFQSSFVPSARCVQVESPVFNTISSPVVSDVYGGFQASC